MAARFDISLLGDQALSKALASLPENLERRVLTRALKQATQLLRGVTQAQAPKLSGRLAGTLKVKALKRRRGRIGYRLSTGSRAELGIPTDARSYYPAHVELGTDHNREIAYMRGSLRQTQQRLLATLRLEIAQGIDREARKL